MECDFSRHRFLGHPSTQHPAPGTALDWVLRWSCNRIRRVLCSTSTSRSFLATTSPKQVPKSRLLAAWNLDLQWPSPPKSLELTWLRDFTTQNQRFQEQNPGGPGPPGPPGLPLRDQRLHWTRGRLDPDTASSQFVWAWEEMGISSKEITNIWVS